MTKTEGRYAIAVYKSEKVVGWPCALLNFMPVGSVYMMRSCTVEGGQHKCNTATFLIT